ncbi:MAG: zf-HC2 domain-containing protein [Pseudomonadota bacterium]
MSRECKKYQKRFVAYLDRELCAQETKLIAAHLTSCTVCRREVQELQELFQALPALPMIMPSERYDEQFWQKMRVLRQEQAEGRAKRWLPGLLDFRLSRRTGLAASGALALFLCVVTFFALKQNSGVPRNELYIAKDIELYSNMEVIENSEILENFEVINMLGDLEQEEKG